MRTTITFFRFFVMVLLIGAMVFFTYCLKLKELQIFSPAAFLLVCSVILTNLMAAKVNASGGWEEGDKRWFYQLLAVISICGAVLFLIYFIALWRSPNHQIPIP